MLHASIATPPLLLRLLSEQSDGSVRPRHLGRAPHSSCRRVPRYRCHGPFTGMQVRVTSTLAPAPNPRTLRHLRHATICFPS